MTRTKNRLILLAIFLIFTLPIVLAAYYYHRGEPIGKLTNHGELLKPPYQLGELAPSSYPQIPKKWSVMIYSADKIYSDKPQPTLHQLNQLWKATGKNMDETQIIVLTDLKMRADLDVLIKKFPSMHRIYLNPKKFPDPPEHIYLVDPKGNVMMRYSDKANLDDVYKDFTKLLRINT